jgi:hypothetical protein
MLVLVFFYWAGAVRPGIGDPFSEAELCACEQERVDIEEEFVELFRGLLECS